MYLNVDNLHKPVARFNLGTCDSEKHANKLIKVFILLNLGFILFMDGINTA